MKKKRSQCLQVIQKGLIFCNIASEASYRVSYLKRKQTLTFQTFWYLLLKSENLIFKHCAKVTFGSIWRKEALATMSTKVWWIGILNLDGRSNQLNFNFGLWGKTNFVCWEIRNIGALRVETSSRMWFVCYWSSGGLPCQESCDGWVLLWVVNPAAGNISLSRVFFASENIWTCETWGQAVTHLQGDQTSFAYKKPNWKPKVLKSVRCKNACDA